MPAEYSADTEAILDRLKKEGSYIRNANKGNSLKNVNINLTKMQGVLNAINTNVLAQTSAFAGAAANQAKIQQEAAEKARRKEELAEVTDPRQAKLDDLKMKAALLRAKSDLKDAKGPGLIAKVKDKASMGFIAKMAAIGGTSFIAGSIIKGALDKIYDPKGDQGGVMGIATKKLEALPNQIETSISKGIQSAVSGIMLDPKIANILSGLETILGIGATAVITAIGAPLGIKAAAGLVAKKMQLASNEKIAKMAIDAKKADVPKNTKYTGFDDPPGSKNRNAKVSMNPIDNEFTRANAKANQNTVQKALSKVTDPLKKAASVVGPKVLKGGIANPVIGPALIMSDLVQTALQDSSVEKLTDEALLSFIKSGEFKKAQETTLKNIAIDTAISAGTSAAIGSVIPGVGTVTGAVGGSAYGLVSGFSRMGIEGYQDMGMIGRDSIPNAVERAIKKQNSLYGNQDLSPEAMKNKLTNAAVEITQARGILEEQVIEIDENIGDLTSQIDSLSTPTEGETRRQSSQRVRKRRGLYKQLKELRTERGTVEGQLQNTIGIQQLSNEEMRKFLESYGRKKEIGKNSSSADVLDMISGSGGLEVAVANVTNINNYNSTTKGGDTNLTNNNVYAEGGGGSREQTAMSPA
jgi:hypothetical protein